MEIVHFPRSELNSVVPSDPVPPPPMALPVAEYRSRSIGAVAHLLSLLSLPMKGVPLDDLCGLWKPVCSSEHS